ncbi:MAG: dTMP kinase [Candidatus Saccharimonadales bacterium]
MMTEKTSHKAHHKGKYLVVEGSDGAGKTTQARMLRERLVGLGILAKELIEPGGTPIGAQIRALLLNPELEKQPSQSLIYSLSAEGNLPIRSSDPR